MKRNKSLPLGTTFRKPPSPRRGSAGRPDNSAKRKNYRKVKKTDQVAKPKKALRTQFRPSLSTENLGGFGLNKGEALGPEGPAGHRSPFLSRSGRPLSTDLAPAGGPLRLWGRHLSRSLDKIGVQNLNIIMFL